ncbi:MAG: hypothetical protein ABIB97_02195 [Patescibacteria group bacterium]
MSKSELAVKLTIKREGDNVFVIGLLGHQGALQIVPSLRDEDLIIEPGGRAHLEFRTITQKPMVQICRSDGEVILTRDLDRDEILITFDPWDHIASVPVSW